jgi:hypothetical protein
MYVQPMAGKEEERVRQIKVIERRKEEENQIKKSLPKFGTQKEYEKWKADRLRDMQKKGSI